MANMFVTLDVSRLSGWLNADAPCRESKEGHAVRGEVYGSGGTRRWTTAAHAVCRGGRDCRLGRRAGGGAHVEHVVHGCDAGGVEAQRLIERRRVLPTVERRACGAGRGARSGGSRRRTTTGCMQHVGERASAD
eukprot:scaffold119389_cov48-Phaeocystis_antarctica.AAC.2